jgi:hypothetical protein
VTGPDLDGASISLAWTFEIAVATSSLNSPLCDSVAGASTRHFALVGTALM